MSESEKPRSLSAPLLIGMIFAAALAPLGSTMMSVGLPAIGADLGRDQAELTQWLVASYLIASIALQSPGGKLGDLIGHRRALILGLLSYAAGSALGLAVANLPALVAARVFMAAGGAAIVPATMALMRTQISAERRARAFGYFGACMSLAAAIGPLLGGELTTAFGWRAIFAANLPVIALALLLVVLTGRQLAHAPTGPRPRFDFGGSILLGAGLAMAVIALRMNSEQTLWLGIGGGFLLAALPFWERRVQAPVIDFRLFRSRAFFAGGAVIALQNLAMYPLLHQLPIFFKQVHADHAHEIGRALLALTLAMTLLSIAGGRLSEKLGARAQVMIGSLLALGGLYFFRDFGALTSPMDAIAGLILIGAGLGLSSAPSNAAAMADAPREIAGMAGGVLSTMRYIGGVIGIAAMGKILVDAKSIADHNTVVYVYAAALATSAALALLLPGRKPRATQQS
ncbi:MAG: MFS transporter [Planctomycetes bacterium]|nr:MFS transporter [Planctomycetota bacterium]